MSDISLKVSQLKNSFSVEGTPLIMSDRFSKEEIAELRKSSTAHESHWYYPPHIWTDDEIAEQINAMLNCVEFDKTQIKDEIDKIMLSLPYEDMSVEKKIFEDRLYKLVYGDSIPLNSEFWRNFGSAPLFNPRKHASNKKLIELQKKYGAVGMDDIFGEKFSNCYHLTYDVGGAVSNFEREWKEIKKTKDLRSQVFTSQFDSLDDIEDNVVVKKITEEAKKFYMDSTKDFEERIKVFSKHGFRQGCIHEPTDRNLRKIFEMHNESDWIQRHEICNTVDIVNYWVCHQLEQNRCKLDYTNPYHPKLKKLNRGYHPSKAAIDRLYKYYVEKLFLEGVGSFEFDW